MTEALYHYLYHLTPDGGVPLKATGILVGLALLAAHLWAFLKPSQAQTFLRDFPRNYAWGVILLTIGFFWSMMIIQYMDMGEFFHLRRWFLIIVPAGFVGVLFYVREFIAVRALGSLMLLAAGPVLCAAFLQPQLSRLLLPILAYAWIISGMFFVGMPFLMRDAITWVTATPSRWKLMSLSGIVYGALLLVAAVLFY
jgi:hypothetical protein